MRSESQKKKKNKREETAKQMATAAVVNQFNAAARQKGYGRKKGKIQNLPLV